MPLHLRLATLEDAPQIHEIYSHFVLNSYATFEEQPPSFEEMVKRMSKVLAFHPWIVCEESTTKVFNK